MPEDRFVAALVHGRYLMDVPPGEGPRRVLVGFHGYGETADVQFERLRRLSGAATWAIVSVQALHPFYRGRTDEVGASWMTRFDRERAIEDNLRYVAAVLDEVGRRHEMARIVYAGFSQGVAMAFRAALRSGHRRDGVMALGGDVPPELRRADLPAWSGLPVLLARGARDEWYTSAKWADDVAVLRRCGARVETRELDAGHEWNSEFDEATGAFLARVSRGE